MDKQTDLNGAFLKQEIVDQNFAQQNKKSDREVQFWEAEECKNIVAECTKEEVFEWIKKHSNYKFEDLGDECGIGAFKWEAELKREGKI